VKKHLLSNALYGVVILCAGLALRGCMGGASELTVAKQFIKKAEDKQKLLFATKSDKAAAIQKEADSLYSLAYANLQTEVLKGSTSANIGEAWFLLGKTSKELKNMDSMAIAFRQAEQFLPKDAKGDQARAEMGGYLFEGWAEGFNKGVELYNAGVGIEDNEAERATKLKEAAETLKRAAALRPENADIYPIIGAALQGAGDSTASVAAYEQYLAFHQPAVEALSSRGVTLSMERSAVLGKLGAPTSSKGVSPLPDTVVMDKFMLGGKEVLVFYPMKDEKFTFEGLKVNIPASWADYERDRYFAFDNRVNLYTSYAYYMQKDYDKALKYAANGLLLNPNNEDLLNLQATIYTESGRTEEAMAALKDRIAKNPNDETSLAQYGSMLSNAGNFDEAIDVFKKTLAINPKSELATFNLAAALKNKASAIQKEEQDKADKSEADRKKNPKAQLYKIDNAKYFPLLKESAEYFERYRKLPGKDRDLNVLEQLINTYEVVEDKEGYRNAASQYAGLEYANEKNPRFYETMARIYGKQKKNDKVKESLDKADALRKAGAK
jgi:tetratricopeptide (TPR) repeat protein